MFTHKENNIEDVHNAFKEVNTATVGIAGFPRFRYLFLFYRQQCSCLFLLLFSHVGVSERCQFSEIL